MHPLEVIMIMSSTAMLLITALLLIVRNMPSRSGVDCWLFAAFTQATIYVIAYFSYPSQLDTAGTGAFFVLQTLVCQAMNIGTLRFIKQVIRGKRRFIACAVVIIGTVTLLSLGLPFLASCLFVAYASFNLLEVAYRIYKLENKTFALKISAVMFVLNALHWLDYPILGQIEWFVPIGFMIGMVLVVSIFLSLCLLALLQFKFQTEESERKAIQAAIHDPLTGLYNRSHLNQLHSEYAEEAEQIQRPFILLYFDLDGFKYVNDTYGHAAGDLILTTVAKRMSKWLGSKGDAIRVGGDELIVLTRLRADFSKVNALHAAQRLLNLIEQPIVDGAEKYLISASVGGCCYGLPNTDLEKMTTEADGLMYKAKQAGGHRIYFSEFVNDDVVATSSKTATQQEV